MTEQMRAFLDSTGGLWQSGALVGKGGKRVHEQCDQHGGQESTILSFHTNLHLEMVIVGLPYAFGGQRIDEISGGSPYGAWTITGGKGERMPSDTDRREACQKRLTAFSQKELCA